MVDIDYEYSTLVEDYVDEAVDSFRDALNVFDLDEWNKVDVGVRFKIEQAVIESTEVACGMWLENLNKAECETVGLQNEIDELEKKLSQALERIKELEKIENNA